MNGIQRMSRPGCPKCGAEMPRHLLMELEEEEAHLWCGKCGIGLKVIVA